MEIANARGFSTAHDTGSFNFNLVVVTKRRGEIMEKLMKKVRKKGIKEKDQRKFFQFRACEQW